MIKALIFSSLLNLLYGVINICLDAVAERSVAVFVSITLIIHFPYSLQESTNG